MVDKENIDLKLVKSVADDCFKCNICVKECAFLQDSGTPGELCDMFLTGHDQDRELFYKCNLCGLCSSVCPKSIDSSSAFLEIRKLLFDRRQKMLPAHRIMESYEKRGKSSLFSSHQFQEDCNVVYFPGCALAGTRAEVTLHSFSYLKSIFPRIGLVLDCCGKPSHDLGKQNNFEGDFGKLIGNFSEKKISRIITACPSCYVTFKKYAKGIEVQTIYEVMDKNMPEGNYSLEESVSIHDACVTRFDETVQGSIRSILGSMNAEIKEMNHSGARTVCCGEGASASFIAPHFTDEWKGVRRNEMNSDRLITYCAGCSSTFGEDIPNTHLLDLLFDFKKAVRRKEKITKSPFTYIKRLFLKWISLYGSR